MFFPLSFTQGQRQNALKPPQDGRRGTAIFASLGVNSPNRFRISPFPFIWGTFRGCSRRRRGRRGAGVTLVFPARSFAFRAAGMGRMWKNAHPEGAQGRGKGQALRWTHSLGKSSGKTCPRAELLPWLPHPPQPSVSSPVTVTFLFIPEHEPRLHPCPAVPVLVLQPLPGSQCRAQGPLEGGAAAQGTSRGHSAGSREGTGFLHSPEDEATPRNCRPQSSSIPSLVPPAL